jgi:hypothetical protein
MALAGQLLANAFDPGRGLHVPLSSHVFLSAKLTENFDELPQQITAHEGTPLCIFANPLALPDGYDRSEFEVGQALPPTLRATNAGFVVATIEHDCDSRDQFEAIVGWTTFSGRFKEVDAELRKHKEYLGYSVVFSGNRSLHFHFVFDTRHLTRAPVEETAAERSLDQKMHSAIMHNVHQIYWDHVNAVMEATLNPSVAADRKLRTYTQWKRMPWGMRKLERDSTILGLPSGTTVPQLVLIEGIRTSRAPKGASSFLVAPEYSAVASPKYHTVAKDGAVRTVVAQTEAGAGILRELESMCMIEWQAASEFQVVAARSEWRIRDDRKGWIKADRVRKGQGCNSSAVHR